MYQNSSQNMHTMKKKIYEEIRLLTELIGKKKLPEILFEAAKGKNEEQMEEFLLKFKRSNRSKLWARISTLSEVYNTDLERPTIFYTDIAVQDSEDYDIYNDDGLVLYNPAEIKPINLCILMLLMDGAMDDDDLFVRYSMFTEYVSKDGYPELANFLKYRFFNTMGMLTEFINVA